MPPQQFGRLVRVAAAGSASAATSKYLARYDYWYEPVGKKNAAGIRITPIWR
jgi:hypothetical protein